MTSLGPLQRVLLAVLALGLVLFVVLPLDGFASEVLYAAIASLSIALGIGSVLSRHLERPAGWLLVLSGMGFWVAGDAVWSFEQYGLDRDVFPAVSDLFYGVGYLLLVAGLLHMVRTRRAGRDRTALLDSLIVATGVAILITTFVLAPLAEDSELSMLAKFVGSFYPVADLLMLAILARMWTIPGSRTWSCLLLSASLALSLVADLVWNLWLVATDSTIGATDSIADFAWLGAFFLVAAAASVPSMRTLSEPLPGPDRLVPSPRRLIALTIGLMLPALVLLVEGNRGTLNETWPIIGVGMLVLTGLVIARMAGLLSVVQTQAYRLAAVARSDSLTGAPNRRTWDHELSRACAVSEADGSPLCVAILDLDSFKAFNDTHGHQAGDRLLREAVAAWTDALGDETMLARYGGEEFAVLLPNHSLQQATTLVQSLRGLTPSDQTFSAGVSLWDPSTEPGTAVAWADDALYRAKRTGRDRVVAHGGADTTSTQGRSELPAFTVVVQPVVAIDSGIVLGHEALSRFHGTDDDVHRVFLRAHAHGYGDLLEACAIRAAMELPGRPAGQQLYVNASPMALASERFWAELPANLGGIVVEINEAHEGIDEAIVEESVLQLRARGALIALDDVGSGEGGREFKRLATLLPDVVKIDRSVVAGCSTDPRRSAVLSALAVYAGSVGALTCAEGIDDPRDLRHVSGLGITHVQGYLLAEPSTRWHTRIDPAFTTGTVTDIRTGAPLTGS